MSRQIAALRESFVADFAFERLFASVRAHMYRQVLLQTKIACRRLRT